MNLKELIIDLLVKADIWELNYDAEIQNLKGLLSEYTSKSEIVEFEIDLSGLKQLYSLKTRLVFEEMKRGGPESLKEIVRGQFENLDLDTITGS